MSGSGKQLQAGSDLEEGGGWGPGGEAARPAASSGRACGLSSELTSSEPPSRRAAAGMHLPRATSGPLPAMPTESGSPASCLYRGTGPGPLVSGCSGNGVCTAAGDPAAGPAAHRVRADRIPPALVSLAVCPLSVCPGSYRCELGGGKLFKGCSCLSGRAASLAHSRYLKIIFLMLFLHFEKGPSQLLFSLRSRDLRSTYQFLGKTRKTALDNRVEFIYWYLCKLVSYPLIFTFLFCFVSFL